jgi:hypothetical protein
VSKAGQSPVTSLTTTSNVVPHPSQHPSQSGFFPLTAHCAVVMLLLLLQTISNVKDTPADFYIQGTVSIPSAITIRTKMVGRFFSLLFSIR